MNGWFEELSQENRSLIDQLRRKGWTKGLRQLAVDKYPDPAHFVYELLQNAEDQNASRASFELTRVRSASDTTATPSVEPMWKTSRASATAIS